MKSLFVLVAAALLPMFAQAGECPVSFENENRGDEIVALIEKAPSCYEAVDIVESCALGASGDVPPASAAITVCEKDFAGKLNKSEVSSYSNLQSKCYEKYDKEQGTMYRSASAFCAMNVSKLFSEIFSPVE